MRIILKRLSSNLDVTLGVLIREDTGLPFLVTLELPDKGNERNVSCIPKGIYKASAHTSYKFKSAYLIEDVPNRGSILIHSGNTVKDTEGCILLGKQYNDLNGLTSVSNSWESLMDLNVLAKKTFELIIK